MSLDRQAILDIIANGESVLIGDILYSDVNSVPDQTAIDTATNAAIPTQYEVISHKSTDATLAANSDSLFSSQKAIKSFIDDPSNYLTTSKPISASDVTLGGKLIKINNVDTAGMGTPAIYSAPAQTTIKTGNFTVLSLNPPAFAGTYRVNGVITTTSSTNTGTVQFTIDYKDSQGTTHTADIIALQDALGVIAATKSGASKEFHAVGYTFTIDNSQTVVALKVVITGAVSYTATGSIERIN